ncbi:WYL domain-containing protein [Clostridium sp. ATCC 25772]|uniref:helix-turn-helix transcriptional regulator n=1 Tax=Clostridium sp. ATCC 25772 TaxID=1676991 RepID=UPI0007829730|nr:WYL domain-containing protein [Clostridium sp. ATCC 25772]
MDRLRIIAVLDILKRKTNEEDSITIKDIQRFLEKYYNMSKITRNTIFKDIETLISLNYDIQKTNGRHNTALYRLCRREFDFSEIRLLVDSMSANKFLTLRQKSNIISKFGNIISERDVKKLKSIVKSNECVSDKVNIIENLNLLHDSINESKKITFRYGKYNENKKFVLKDKIYKGIPKEIYYDQDRYYLIALEDNVKKHYRVDRICNIELKECHSNNEKIPMEMYSILNFDMFTCENIDTIKLRVDKSLLNSVVEKFGIKSSIRKDLEYENKFILVRKVGINKGLLRWILKQGKDIEVLEPIYLREKIIKELEEINNLYKNT